MKEVFDHNIIDPDGNHHKVSNMRQFCREHNLDIGNMLRVVWGIRRHHKGYTCPDAGYVRIYRGEPTANALKNMR